MTSPTQWTRVWVSSRSRWWAGKPGMLQSLGSRRVRHDWVNWTELIERNVTPKQGNQRNSLGSWGEKRGREVCYVAISGRQRARGGGEASRQGPGLSNPSSGQAQGMSHRWAWREEGAAWVTAPGRSEGLTDEAICGSRGGMEVGGGFWCPLPSSGAGVAEGVGGLT